MKEKIIQQGVNNLKEFGYEYVTKENIITDEVYSMMFKSMLKENLGITPASDLVINEILAEIK